MLYKGWIAAFLLLVLPAAGEAAENGFSAKYRLEHRQGASTDQLSDQVLNDTLLQSTLRYQHSWDWRADAVLRARYESELEPKAFKELNVRELYLTHNTEDYSLKLGRQQVVWGKTDGLRLLDVVNPLDLREFLLDDFVDSRIPLWMLNSEWYLGDNSVQFLLIPDLTFDRLAKPGSRFYFAPDVPPGFQAQTIGTNTPAQSPINWKYALKWARQVGDWDLTLNGIYGWGNDPVYFYQFKSPDTIEFQPEIRRRRILGASGDKPFGDSVLRFEATYTPDEYRQINNDFAHRGFIRQKLLSFALGWDWYKNNWLISPQWFQESIINPDAELTKRANTSYVSLLVNKKFMHDKLELKMFYLYGVTDHDKWFEPSVSYQISGRYELSLTFDVFSGNADTVFGRFNDNDRVVLGLAAYL
jgi:hypothetical protein